MAPETMVVEDGVDDTMSKGRTTPPWLLALVGFGLGLVLGTLVSFRDESPEATSTSTPFAAVEEPVEDEPDLSVEAGVTSVIPDFPNALVGVGVSEGSGGGALDHLLWPATNPLVVRGMTGGSDVRFDATGQFVALTETVPELPGVLLSMGRITSIRPVISGVTSYAWHDSRSGELAFTTERGGGWQLYEASRTLVPVLVADGGYEGGSIVGWGDWGYAIQTSDGQVALLNGDGGFKDLEPGRAIASHPSGWIFVAGDGLKLVSAGGGVQRLLAPEDGVESMSAASFSPDRSKVALAGDFGVKVLVVGEEDLVDLSPVFPSDWVTWSSDGRFVISPANRGVYVHDLESGETHHVLADHSVVAAAVLPVAAS